MASEHSKPDDIERNKLLEEIRKRSEEAEMRRIDEEFDQAPAEPERVSPAPMAPSPFPLPAAETAPLPLNPAGEQKAMVLRERFLIALDRGKVDKAAEILSELGVLVPHDERLPGFRMRLLDAQAEQAWAKEQHALPPEPKPQEPPPVQKRDDDHKRLVSLLEAANQDYEQEKYDNALARISQALVIDPANDEALAMHDQIEKARSLAERVRVEEAKHKEEEASMAPKFVQELPPVMSNAPGDVWGSGAVPHGDVGFEIAPEEKGPVGPPKPPLIATIVRRVSKVKIPIRPLVTVLAVLAVVAAAYFVIDRIRTTVEPPQFSLVVLPAAGLADSSSMILADGVTEDLIKDLGEASELRVINAPTMFAFRTASVGPLQLARNLGANHYLRWSVASLPDGVHLEASLYDTLSQTVLWTTQQQASLRELPGLRRELAKGIFGAIGVTLSENEETAFRNSPVIQPEAYAAYLAGRSMARHPERYSPQAVVEAFEQAVSADSSFADAWAALGWARIVLYERVPVPSEAQLTGASACVQQAIALGSRSSETFRVWGLVEQGRGEYVKAMSRLEQAANISPSDGESQRRLAIVSAIKGESDVALAAAEHAVSDDPANVRAYTVLGLIRQFRGEYKDALQAYERGMRFASDRSEYGAGFYADVLVYTQQHDRAMDVFMDRIARVRQSPEDLYKLGRVEQSAGRPKEDWQGVFQRARDELIALSAANTSDAVTLSQLALVYTRLGEFKSALTTITRALQLAPRNLDVLYNTARVYAVQRDKKQALDYLGLAINELFSLEKVLDMDFFSLRADPEFIATITR